MSAFFGTACSGTKASDVAGNAVADVLTGKTGLTGTLPMPYYSSTDQIGKNKCWKDTGWNALKD